MWHRGTLKPFTVQTVTVYRMYGIVKDNQWYGVYMDHDSRQVPVDNIDSEIVGFTPPHTFATIVKFHSKHYSKNHRKRQTSRGC